MDTGCHLVVTRTTSSSRRSELKYKTINARGNTHWIPTNYLLPPEIQLTESSNDPDCVTYGREKGENIKLHWGNFPPQRTKLSQRLTSAQECDKQGRCSLPTPPCSQHKTTDSRRRSLISKQNHTIRKINVRPDSSSFEWNGDEKENSSIEGEKTKTGGGGCKPKDRTSNQNTYSQPGESTTKQGR